MKRSLHMDILRAIAVILVLGRHMDTCPVTSSKLVHDVTFYLVQGGWIGVDIFFVLSGFLISGLLFQEHIKLGRIDVKQFLIRRGLKICPGLWLLIAVTFVFTLLRGRPAPFSATFCELFFMQNYGPELWTHTWSLAVEAHFYLLLVTLFILLTRRRDPGPSNPFRAVPLVCGAIALLCLGFRFWNLSLVSFGHKTHIFPTHLRMDSLFCGVLISYFYHRDKERFLGVARRFRYFFLIAGVALVLPAFMFRLEKTPLLATIGFTGFYLAGGFLLIGGMGSPPSESWLARALAYIGSHSYSIYLWHMSASMWIAPRVLRWTGKPNSWFLYASVYLIGSLVLGIIMTSVVEFPVLRLRDRFFPSRARPISIPDTPATAPASATDWEKSRAENVA